MAIEKRGVQNLKTMAGMQDARRSRTASGALLELSMLEMERQRLSLEMQRAEARRAEVLRRIDEIDRKATRLHAFVEKRASSMDLTFNQPLLAGAKPLTIHQAMPDKMKRRALQY
jgi:hypothetical protein